MDGLNRGFFIGFHAHPARAGGGSGVSLACRCRPGRTEWKGVGVWRRACQLRAADPRHRNRVSPGLSASYLEEDFDLFYDDEGGLALQFITLIPATRTEFELVRGQADDKALRDLWESCGTDLLDVYRTPAV
ncbi:hypothetical protein GCM10023322_12170 [Rugosimonospora acidiphila]|uniref:Suppressor of fused-like domain-containing protein n=1 Tax=Rugosimonospora acidiphila TaxID=556531 RepID=A0ABP9RLG3_9ACTN